MDRFRLALVLGLSSRRVVVRRRREGGDVLRHLGLALRGDPQPRPQRPQQGDDRADERDPRHPVAGEARRRADRQAGGRAGARRPDRRRRPQGRVGGDVAELREAVRLRRDRRPPEVPGVRGVGQPRRPAHRQGEVRLQPAGASSRTGTPSGRRPGASRTSSENGLHYSWDWNGVHFVMANLYPADKQHAEGAVLAPVARPADGAAVREGRPEGERRRQRPTGGRHVALRRRHRLVAPRGLGRVLQGGEAVQRDRLLLRAQRHRAAEVEARGRGQAARLRQHRPDGEGVLRGRGHGRSGCGWRTRSRRTRR